MKSIEGCVSVSSFAELVDLWLCGSCQETRYRKKQRLLIKENNRQSEEFPER